MYNIKNILFEHQIYLLEFRGNFKLNEFEKLKTLQDKKEYAERNLGVLGEGSSRITFPLSSRYVLKLARPEASAAGRAQNKEEVDVYTNPLTKSVVAQIQDFDKDYGWLISELVRPLKNEEDFTKTTKIDWLLFHDIMSLHSKGEDWKSDLKKEMQETIKAKIKREKMLALGQKINPSIIKSLDNKIINLIKVLKSSFIEGVTKLIDEIHVSPGDMKRIEHWGKTADNRVVLLDYGLTKSTEKYYKSGEKPKGDTIVLTNQ